MDKILWFCRSSDSSSLSRITDSVIPILKSKFDITLISNKSNLTGIKNVIMGADTSEITYTDFIKGQKDVNDNTIRSINMKYVLVQIVDLLYDNDYKYLILCNGIYEIDWLTRVLTKDPNFLINKNGQRTKVIVWSPIDYIPTLPIIENVIKSDLFITMTPIMTDEIKKICPSAKIDWVGHGSDISNENTYTHKDIIKKLNDLRTSKFISCKDPIKTSDIIILNANNYGPFKNGVITENGPGTRKRLDITIKSFLSVLGKYKDSRLKLWIHTELRSFFEMLSQESIHLETFIDNIIFSSNSLTSEQLSLVYRASKISLQTSYSEGWSLTNMEAAVYRSLQVVPDFLACGWHFNDGKGVLIPVTRKIIKNEADHNVTIGVVSIEDTVAGLSEAIDLINDTNSEKLNNILDKAQKYAKSYTWVSIADKLESLIKNT